MHKRVKVPLCIFCIAIIGYSGHLVTIWTKERLALWEQRIMCKGIEQRLLEPISISKQTTVTAMTTFLQKECWKRHDK